MRFSFLGIATFVAFLLALTYGLTHQHRFVGSPAALVNIPTIAESNATFQVVDVPITRVANVGTSADVPTLVTVDCCPMHVHKLRTAIPQKEKHKTKSGGAHSGGGHSHPHHHKSHVPHHHTSHLPAPHPLLHLTTGPPCC